MAQQPRGFFNNRNNQPPRNQNRQRQRPQDWYERDPMDERSGYRDEDSSEYRRPSEYYRPSDYPESSYDYAGGRGYRPRDLDRSLNYGQGQSYGQRGYETNQNYRPQQQSYERRPGRDFSSQQRVAGAMGSGGYYEPSGEESQGTFAGKGPRNYTRSDERITEEINEMLTRHPDINAEEIEVQASQGRVTLSGSVPERYMKHLAEDVAEQCLGVKEVTNNLRVKKGEEAGLSNINPDLNTPRH